MKLIAVRVADIRCVASHIRKRRFQSRALHPPTLGIRGDISFGTERDFLSIAFAEDRTLLIRPIHHSPDIPESAQRVQRRVVISIPSAYTDHSKIRHHLAEKNIGAGSIAAMVCDF